MGSVEILDFILQTVKMNEYQVAQKLGIAVQTLYNIRAGKTKRISDKLANNIVSHFPFFNKSWLISGDGEAIVSAPANQTIIEGRGVTQYGNVTLNETIASKIEDEVRNIRVQLSFLTDEIRKMQEQNRALQQKLFETGR